MTVVRAVPGMPGMTDAEVDEFLKSKLNMHIATVDGDGLPNVHPVWFHYDGSFIYMLTGNPSTKLSNVQKNPNVYFCIDDDNFPPKGVKGRGAVRVSEDVSWNLSEFEKIYTKYLGALDHPIARMRREQVARGSSIVLEIKPEFFSSWDMGKSKMQ